MSRTRNAHRAFPHVSELLVETVLKRRKALKLSQSALAEKAGVTRNCIQQMECYEHMPLPSTMFRLLQALDFSEEEAAEFWVVIDAAYQADRSQKEESAGQKGVE